MSSRAAIQMRPGAGPHNLHKKKAESKYFNSIYFMFCYYIN